MVPGRRGGFSLTVSLSPRQATRPSARAFQAPRSRHYAEATGSRSPAVGAGKIAQVSQALRQAHEDRYVRLDDLDKYMRSNAARFPYVFPGVALLAAAAGGCSIYANWDTHRRDLATEAAEVAQDLLLDNDLQKQLDELSKTLIASLLNDPTTLVKVTTFVEQILANPSINDSVLAIVLRVIHDERTVNTVVELLQRVLARSETKDALVNVLSGAMQDDLGKDAAIEYVRAVVAAEETKELLADLARTQIGSVLNAEDTKQAARNFVETVLQDETLQARSAEAVWRIIRNAFWPRIGKSASNNQATGPASAGIDSATKEWPTALDTAPQAG